jgi:adenine-specific DNA-methyltransferase
MTPRLWMMRDMLKVGGIVAVCIDHRELFRLGMLMDEVFREENRLAIINWQKSAAPRSDNSHVSTSTEYVLVYAKELAKARTGSLERTTKDNNRYSNPDNDPQGLWREGNLTARSYSQASDYAIQSPFNGQLFYPPGNRSWSHAKGNILNWLAEWGSEYEERDIGDGKAPALMWKDCRKNSDPDRVRERAALRLDKGDWPFVWFGRDGQGRPRIKTYLEQLKRGKVPVTYWAEEDPGYPAELDATSWGFRESGRSSDGVLELSAIVGDKHAFTTVKPLKLFKKIIQIWCGNEGIVLDPFGGSG